MAPPTAAVEARKSRRFMSTFSTCGGVATFAVIVAPSLSGLDLGLPVDGRPDARIGPTAADVGHLAVDVGVGRLRLPLEQVHRGHDLPRLAVSALGNIELDPRQLDRMRPLG